MKTIFQQLKSDIRFHELLKTGGMSNSVFSMLRIFLTSRGLWFSFFYRIIYFSTNARNLRSISWWVARILEIPAAYLSVVACKCGVLGDCVIEEGVYLSDAGYLTCGAASIGSGSIIHDHVTFGLAVANRKPGRPFIGRNVWVGPNCVIAGGLEVGDGTTILPDSYLTFSVPPGSVVRGNPARIVRENFDNREIRRSLAVVQEAPQS
jgi:acetyltransferase-like isoleucine patch superfamily enzyme